MMTQLAHNLNDNKWRSDDINIGSEEESEVTFSSLNLKENILLGLKTNGFIRLSAIQLHAIPLGRCGLDLILQSKSGTGKTCVFVVIALELLESIQSNAVQVMVICPTREIAVQTSQVMTSLSKHMPNIRCCPVIGGTKVKEDVHLMSRCQAVVGTPGRLKQLIDLNVLKTNSIRLLVLDECDKLLDNNFKQQIDDIFECLPQNKQTIAVSATMTTPLADFLRQYMRTPVFVRLNADNPALIGVKQLFRITPCHHLNHINFDNKIEPLIQILKTISFSQCLVFSNYQTRARMLCDKLNAQNWRTTYISAEKCQTERLKAISKLRKYKCRILVSTDLTARGIDVENINLVVNMDTPFDAQTYLHRIGRAGRFGTRGIAITIASSGREEEQLKKIIKECKLKVEELKEPIPEDIWKMDDLSEEFLVQNKNDSQKPTEESNDESEEYNPFDDQSVKSDNSNEGSNQLMSFNDIIKEYKKIEESVESEDNEECDQQNDYKCLESIQTEQNLDDFYEKCIIYSKECDFEANVESIGNNIELNEDIETSSCDVLKTENQINYSLNCNEIQTSVEYNSNEYEMKTNSNDSSNSSANLIQSGFTEWANALFPPISSVNRPVLYNQWLNKNRYLWSYMLNPFQTFPNTQNREQNQNK